MRKSFYIFRLFAVIIILGTICLTMTSCDPDDVDAFAKGYRDGYNSTHSRMSNTDIPEAQETDTNAE